MTDRDSARAAKDRLRAELGPLDGVGGIGIGRRHGSYVVTVDVVAESDGERVPSSWDGVDVEVRVIGRVRPLTVPTGGVPAGGVPAGGVPAGGVPAGGVPAGGAPTGGLPTGAVPAGPLTGGRGAGSGARWRSVDRDGRGTGR